MTTMQTLPADPFIRNKERGFACLESVGRSKVLHSARSRSSQAPIIQQKMNTSSCSGARLHDEEEIFGGSLTS